jgi:hypothetical protein
LEQLKDEPKKKKPRWKKLVRWLVVDLLVATIIILLLLYKPGSYHPFGSLFEPNDGRVSPYVSRELLPQFNNGIQARRPFRMTILEKPLNEIVTQFMWPQEMAGVVLTKPQVAFEPNLVVLMGTATTEGAPFIVTMELRPQFNEQGLLNLNLEQVKVGAMPVTLVARFIGKQKYEEQIAAGDVDMEDPRTKIAAAIFTGQPFDPVFTYDGKKVRVKNAVVTKGQLEVEFVPAR